MIPVKTTPSATDFPATLECIERIGEFETRPGSGIAFQIDVEDAVGVTHQATALSEALDVKQE